MIVMFAPEACVINGVDSELYVWGEKLPRIEDLTDGMPPALQKLMGSREVKKMKSTFCVLPRGLDFLHEVCSSVKIPVYAIGGINDKNAASCIRAVSYTHLRII